MNWVNLIISLVIPVLGIIITYFLVPILKQKNIYQYVTIAVNAAEQIFGAGTGAQKFEYVKKWLQAKFSLSDEDVKNLIEAAVLEMNKLLNAGG